jgi:hypothetical protein
LNPEDSTGGCKCDKIKKWNLDELFDDAADVGLGVAHLREVADGLVHQLVLLPRRLPTPPTATATPTPPRHLGCSLQVEWGMGFVVAWVLRELYIGKASPTQRYF